jgi:hypothetical protein
LGPASIGGAQPDTPARRRSRDSSAEAGPGCFRHEPDQSGIRDCRLTVPDRLAAEQIADHFDDRRDASILVDEAEVPALLRRSEQRQFEPAARDDLAARPEQTSRLWRP